MLSTHTGRNDKWLFLGEFSEYLLKTENEQTQGTLTTPSKRIPASLQQDNSSTKFQRVESTSAMQSSGFLSDEFQIAQTRVSHQKFSLSLSFHKRKWMIFGASQLPVPLIRVNISGDLVTNNSERRKVLPQGKMSLLFYVACIGICCFHGIELCPTSHCDLKEYFCKGCSGSKIWSPPLTLLGGEVRKATPPAVWTSINIVFSFFCGSIVRISENTLGLWFDRFERFYLALFYHSELLSVLPVDIGLPVNPCSWVLILFSSLILWLCVCVYD